jgi:hypothetical protein
MLNRIVRTFKNRKSCAMSNGDSTGKTESRLTVLDAGEISALAVLERSQGSLYLGGQLPCAEMAAFQFA